MGIRMPHASNCPNSLPVKSKMVDGA